MKRQGIVLWCIVILYSISLAFFAPLEWSDNSVSVEYGGVTAEQLLAYSKENENHNVMSNEIDSISWPSILKGLECDACKFIAGFMQGLFRLNKTDAFIAKAAIFWCEKLKIEDTRVCSGIVPEFENEVLTLFDEVGLEPKEICGLILGPSCSKVRDLYPDWNITLPNVPKPPVQPIPPPKVSEYLHF
jgi:sphingomyelin phosphodiesterase